ncbi:hypothetical protein O0L34_g14288 [Tuta absoluta]|nr:hypothetical protein O0L34_g14288 [Tuta absoluta]
MMSAGVVWRSLPARRLAALRHCLAALGLPPAGLHRAHHYLHLLDTAPQVSHTPPRMMSAGVVWRSLPARRLAALRHCLAALGLPPAGLHRAHHYLHLLDTAPQVSHTPPRMMSAGVVWRSLPARRLAALRHCLAALGLPPAGLHRAHHYLHLLDTAPQVRHTPPRMMSAGVVWRSLPARRLAALRHCLAALGLPPAGLHRAHHYLHLLDTAPQEIIAGIREHGAQFSELEYLNALKVVGARLALPQPELRALLQQLSAALGHVGVTV